MHHLIFIDTNVLLDFYRVRGQETDLSILDRIDSHHDRLISTYQVEMEYKKNRQNVIKGTIDSLKLTPANVTPAFLKSSQPNQTLSTSERKRKQQIEKLRSRTIRCLSAPGRNDPVYRCAQRLFRARGPSHLTREKKIRLEIRELAKKRFLLGYPPRKNSDTNIGDAINWEWIVHVANQTGANIVVVTRDSDYGVVVDQRSYLNDWLDQEFRQRVSRKRKIVLTSRLTEGFKLAGIKVSQREVRRENELLDTVSRDLVINPSTGRLKRLAEELFGSGVVGGRDDNEDS